MIEQYYNPYDSLDPKTRFIRNALEIPSGIGRLPSSLRKRKYPEGLIKTRLESLHSNYEPGAMARPDTGSLDWELHELIGSGYFFDCFRFTNGDQQYVMKVGAVKPPVIGYLSPTDPDYTQWYNCNLAVLKEVFADRMPHFIPAPQQAFYLKTAELPPTTVIVQPYFEVVIPISGNPAPNDKNQRGNLADEINTYWQLTKTLKHDYGLWPDLFLTAFNMAFAKRPGMEDLHLVLLDCGLMDKRTPTPFLNHASYMLHQLRVKKAMQQLK